MSLTRSLPRTLAAVAAASASALAALVVPATPALAADELDPPRFSRDGGRFTGPTTVELTAADGAQIRYTLDGTAPTASSPLYTGPITVEESANVAAVAVRGGVTSVPEVEGFLIKTPEEPLLSFVVLSDIETTTYDDASRARWDHYFDTITALQPEPDLIFSNGDQIADNYYDSGADHAVVRALLEDGLASHGLDSTRVLLSYGNHDDRLAVMTQHYPTDWFPHAGDGYYEQVVEGHHFLVLNTESYGSTQRAWLQGRLAAIAAEPGALHRPVFVLGHRPTTGTVQDGAQASNPAIAQDLAAYPQAVYVSGHSHLNLNSEKSIHQGAFTAVNDGSMSYTQIPRDAYQDYGDDLVDNFTLPVPQGLLVEVYADRTEIDRVAFSAEPRRTYVDGAWSPFPPTVPTRSAGTLAGPTWTVRLEGSTPAEVRAGFAYTAQARADRTAPALGAAPTVRRTATRDELRIPAATDASLVAGYQVQVTDASTGAVALPFRSGTMVSADYFFSPRPAVLDVPLSVRQGLAPTAPVVGLVPGTTYVATVRAVDEWGNRSAPASVTFVAGQADRAALDAAWDDARPVVERVERVLGGDAAAALPGDLDVHVQRPAEARAAVAELRALVAAASEDTTSDAVDARAARVAGLASALAATLAVVDRSGLQDAVADAEQALAAKPGRADRGNAGWRLKAELAEARALLVRLDVPQGALDRAEADLRRERDRFPHGRG